MPMSSQLSLAIANLVASNTPVSAFAGADRYLALHHADPTISCTVQELVGDGYARVLIPISIINLPKGKGIVNSEVIVFPVGTGTKAQQVTHGSIWDSLNGGTPLTYGALTAPANWLDGHSLSLAVNAFIQLIRNTI